MRLFRIEMNVTTGVRVEIDQTAYRNGEGEVIVLDAGSSAPEGYSAFDPSEGEVVETTE